MISTCGDAEPYGDPVNIIVPITMTITFVIVCSSAIMARIVSEFVQVSGVQHFITARNEVRGGNVFTGICLSMGRGR